MPWKEVIPMEQRIGFVLKVKSKEVTFRDACREYGVSRKTGYKWWKRYEGRGLDGLYDRSRRPMQSPHQTREKIQKRVIELRLKYGWGSRKLRVLIGSDGKGMCLHEVRLIIFYGGQAC